MRLVIPYFPGSSLILSFQVEFLFPVRRYGRTKGKAFLLTYCGREICQSEKSAIGRLTLLNLGQKLDKTLLM